MAAVLYIAITTLILIAVLYKKAQKKKIEAFLKRIENLEKQVQNLKNEIEQIKK